MLTKSWKTERVAAGKYHVRLDGNRIPGMILGGNGKYVIQRNGQQWPTARKTLRSAAADLVAEHTGIG